MQYLTLTEQFYSQVVNLANNIHGENYISQAQLAQMCQQGIKQGINASFVAVSDDTVIGYRLSFAAGQWQVDNWCSTSLWPVAESEMAYFKSVGVDSDFRGKGVAKQLLTNSISALQAQGARAGLAHIWRESPGNAAQAYFANAGATLLKVHADRWLHLCESHGYQCPLCGERCHCSAAEMVLRFV